MTRHSFGSIRSQEGTLESLCGTRGYFLTLRHRTNSCVSTLIPGPAFTLFRFVFIRCDWTRVLCDISLTTWNAFFCSGIAFWKYLDRRHFNGVAAPNEYPIDEKLASQPLECLPASKFELLAQEVYIRCPARNWPSKRPLACLKSGRGCRYSARVSIELVFSFANVLNLIDQP